MTQIQAAPPSTAAIITDAVSALPATVSPEGRELIAQRLRAVADGKRYEEEFFWISSVALLWRTDTPADDHTVARGWDGRPDAMDGEEGDDVHFALLDRSGAEIFRWEGAAAVPLIELGTLGWREEGGAYGPGPLQQFQEGPDEPDEAPEAEEPRPSWWRRCWRRMRRGRR